MVLAVPTPYQINASTVQDALDVLANRVGLGGESVEYIPTIVPFTLDPTVGHNVIVGVGLYTGYASTVGVGLPQDAGRADGSRVTITDTVGNAAVKNIVVIAGSGRTINGQASFTINVPYGSVSVFKAGAANWCVY